MDPISGAVTVITDAETSRSLPSGTMGKRDRDSAPGHHGTFLCDKRIGYAGNAIFGQGGQGEFLRQMVFVLDQLPHSLICSRSGCTGRANALQFPFAGSPRKFLFDCVRSVPMLRRRHDWLTLLSDLDFDHTLADRLDDVDLLDAVSGQCAETFRTIKSSKTKLVLTSLNTHVDNLVETLEYEHRAVGFRGWSFVHPRMRRRMIGEIGLADHIRVNSHWAKSTFVNRGVPSEKIDVVQPGIDHAHFYPVEKSDEVFRVLAVSSIDPRKGIHYLLRAFEEARIPNSELVIIGGTGDRWSRKMLGGFQRRNSNIRQQVLDVTTVPVTQTYGSASVLVHPALEDGYGLVIPQSLASGCPVIATRQSGASELIKHGENGFVIDRRCSDTIRDHLRLMASDPSLLQSMRRAAPAAVAHLGYGDFAASVLSLYERLLG